VLVKVHDVPAAPQEWVITTGAIVLGAGRGADLVIGDDSVSRKHLQIALSNQGIEVVDLNSSNGTYYQGQRIGRLTLDREATFLLGRVKVTVMPQVEVDTSQDAEVTRYGDLLGVSESIRHLFSKLNQLEQSTVPLLIEGGAGTGKELMAREIHQRSPIRTGPFIAVGTLTGDVSTIRHQLFGIAGSLSGQSGNSKAGALEQAHNGTIFFDEIAALPLELQPLLLTVLETGKVQRTGENEERAANVRIIAASRQCLANEVTAGRFRQDLYYRLNVVLLRLPSLREHREDIGVLAQHFAAMYGVLRLPPQVIEQLERYDWPGNVRELRNVIRGYAAVGELPQAPIENDSQLAEMLRRVLDVERPYQQQKDHIVNKFLDVYLSMLLEHTGGNQSQASRMSGIERAHLNRMIAKLRADSKRNPSGTMEVVSGSSPPPAGKRRNSTLPPRSK
jgi:DNA-binding NtrC family response regulator